MSRLRFTINVHPYTGLVHVRTRQRYRDPNGRPKLRTTGSLRLPRDQIRQLCDMLHDYADRLDRQDRERNEP